MRTFGICVADSGTKLYSAWWCPYCFAQLQEFDPAMNRVEMGDTEKVRATFPFLVECADGAKAGRSTPGVCTGIVRAFPTWVFKDGTKMEGGRDLIFLSEKTKCALPR